MLADQAREVEQRRGTEAAQQWFNVSAAKALPLSELFQRYLDGRRADLARGFERDLKTEEKRLTELFKTQLSQVLVTDITPETTHRYHRQFLTDLSTPRCPKGLSEKSIAKSKTILASMFDWAVDKGHLPHDHINPWKAVRRSFESRSKAAKAKQESKRRPYTAKEWLALKAEASTKARYRPMLTHRFLPSGRSVFMFCIRSSGLSGRNG